MVPVGDGTYKIVNALSLLDMEVYEASLSHGELFDQRGMPPARQMNTGHLCPRTSC